MNAATRLLVRQRATDRCEYCRLPQFALRSSFHVEHIIASQHGLQESDDPANLALACGLCNLHKGTNLASVDPLTNKVVPLFHPRQADWIEHFTVVGSEIVGQTPSGRATVRLLQMNITHRVRLRAALIAAGEWEYR